MIKKVKRTALDLEKYSNCLAKSVNYRIYAEHWYLDSLMGNSWDCYVLNDYEAIMPVPYLKKFGLNFITQPIYCQQLGVFHQENFTQDLFDLFEDKLKKRLVKGYHFNEENIKFQSISKESKINQILPIDSNYEPLISSLRKNRKQEIRKGLPENFTVKYDRQDQSFLQLLETEYNDFNLKEHLSILHQLVAEIQRRNLGFTINISENDKIVASSFYIQSKTRLIQLCNAKKENQSINFNTHIIAFILKNYPNYILDFEGSSLKGVHEFNASFRAEITRFSIYRSMFF